MNTLINSLEALQETICELEGGACATRIRGALVELLHKNEFTVSQSDPNHPYSRFAKHGDAEGNRLRLFNALEEMFTNNEDGVDLDPSLDMMFDVPDTDAYNDVQLVLRRYMRYANLHRSESESDTDSEGDTSDSDSS